MRKLIGLCIVLVFLVGCGHCSRTLTKFNGKTKGMNPYGDGDITMDREAYWGNLDCIRTLIEKTYNITPTDEEIAIAVAEEIENERSETNPTE